MKRLDNYGKLVLVILILAVIVRFSLASVYHVSGDACWQLSNAKFMAENQKIPVFEQFGRDEPFWPPPLFHIISAFIYGLFINFSKPIADFAIKMVSPLLGSLTLIAFFLIAKDLFNRKIALLSLLFLAFIPLHMDYSVFSYVDGTVTFLAVLSVYLALKNRLAWSSVIAGLAVLTKYNGIFILPVIWFIFYLNSKKDFKIFTKKFFVISGIAGAIGSIWFLRNWILLGNPVWPFVNGLFNGYEVASFAEANVGNIDFSNILSLSGLITFYLGIFGVPNGNISTLTFFNIPYLNILLAIWLLSTITFLIPLFLGISAKKIPYRKLLFIWIFSYIALLLLYILNASWAISRFLLPAFPALALIWAHGIENIKQKKAKKYLISLLVIIMAGFVLTSYAKIGLAANAWNFYEQDFQWAMENTETNAVFLSQSQCLSYNLERQTVAAKIENLGNADYVFVNQDFDLDGRVVLERELLGKVEEHGILVYNNNETGTQVFNIS